MKAIKNGVLLMPEGMVSGKALFFDEHIIGVQEEDQLPDMETIDARGKYVSPGLIDLHIHGYLGEDVSDGSKEGVRRIANGLLANGVTGFLPTTMTLRWEEIEEAVDVIRTLMPISQEKSFIGSEILGVHAEGPFINPQRKGAQAAAYILPPDADRMLQHRDVVRIVTMAPEMPNGIAFIKQIRKESDIVVSIGHSNADFTVAMEAIKAGASYITHLFNTMTGLAHREPGVVGAALVTDVAAELIADTLHVHPALFPMLTKLKDDRLVLVTDCTRAGGLGDGMYTLGGQPITVNGIACRLRDGTIAGSVLTLNQAVKNLIEHTGLPLEKAVRFASLHPARAIGLENKKGSLAPGKDADIALFDDQLNAHMTIVRGEIKYTKGKEVSA